MIPQSDVMIDIETLGTRPGCVVRSIGAVRFNRDSILDTFKVNITVESCTEVGLVIDPKTQAWWDEKSDAAKAGLLTPEPIALTRALYMLSDWCMLVGAVRYWCHGATFDIPILTAAYDAVGAGTPWNYAEARDTRTIYELADTYPDRTAAVHHDALVDATQQALAVMQAWKVLGR